MGRKILLFLTVLIVSLVFAGEFRSIEAISLRRVEDPQTEDYWYPFYYLDEEGARGIDVELGRTSRPRSGETALRTGRRDTRDPGHTSERRGGRHNIELLLLLPLQSLPGLCLARLSHTEPVAADKQSGASEDKNEVDELTPEKLIENLNDPSISVLVMIGTVYERIALQLLPGTKIFSIGTTENLAGLLFEKNYDVFFMNDLWTETFLVKNPSLLIHYSIYRLPSEDQIVVGVNPANTDLLEWINRFLDSDYNKTRSI